MVPASRARFHDAETYVLTLKKSRVVDRGGRARRGTERVDGKRVVESTSSQKKADATFASTTHAPAWGSY